MRDTITYFDIFNGDADGICALQQLRLHTPRASTLITGVKRDINLLGRIETGGGATLTVLDISMQKNRADLIRLLADGAEITYFDHHQPGTIPDHPRLQADIDTDANICTSLLVNRHLAGAHARWAAVGAFGDNLFDAANRMLGDTLTEAERMQLQQLGTLMNYNGYGVTTDDLHFHPADLYRAIHPFDDPLRFVADHPAFATLKAGYDADMARIQQILPEESDAHCHLIILPDCDWSRRASGVYGNLLARHHPNRAHALATLLPDGNYRISVRAPLANKQGADRLCARFPTGGGRAAAAGINALPQAELAAFIDTFRHFWR